MKKNWSNIYNLGDMIITLNPKGLIHPKESIVHRYLSGVSVPLSSTTEARQPWKSVDFDLVSSIVSSRTFDTVPDEILAIHARVGDILKMPKEKQPSPEDYVSIVTSNRLSERFDRCYIFHGNHRDMGVPATKRYLDALVTALEGSGMKCELVSNSVDDDFCALATAKNFLVGYRTFSWLAASINPNNVIWDVQNPPNFRIQGRLPRDRHNILLSGYQNHLSIKT